jgi:hypothetical protein
MPRRPWKADDMSKLQWAVLDSVRQGEDPYSDCRGSGDYGGRTSVLKSLEQRGLIVSVERSVSGWSTLTYSITPAGIDCFKPKPLKEKKGPKYYWGRPAR